MRRHRLAERFLTDVLGLSWWSQRFGVREKNIGWRIDYVLAAPAAMEFVRGAAIHPEIKGSDHCPISVAVDGAIFRGSP